MTNSPKPHQKMQLVQLGSYTITINETPLIECEDEDSLTPWVLAVNFLRCGCPSVQLYMPFKASKSQDELAELGSFLNLIQTDNERFKTTQHSNENNLLIEITRTKK